MSRLPVLCVMLLALGLCSPGRVAYGKPPPPSPLRVLFVGNSYLYTHDVSQVFADVAAARGIVVEVGLLAEPDFAIEDHLALDAFTLRLAEGWHWIVLQQGPSSLPESQVNLRIHAGRAALLAHATGARTALMSAWPALPNAHTWLAAESSYRNAALANGLCVLPVATAWRLAREQAPGIALYQPDQLHPEREGTLLAALVVARDLLRRPQHVDAPVIAASPSDPAWEGALQHTETLDRIARAALELEGPRCERAKSQDSAAPGDLREPVSAPGRESPRTDTLQ
jgi:hypothetical protein